MNRLTDSELDSLFRSCNITMLLDGIDNMQKLEYKKKHPKEQTPDMAFGIAYHIAVFEPGDLEKRVVELPFDDLKKQAARDWRDEREALGQIVLKADAVQKIKNMKDALLRHHDVLEILSIPGKSEVALEWTDPDTQLLCKGRIDFLNQYKGYTWLWDLKTCQSCKLEDFQKDLYSNLYHCRADWYLSGCNALHEADRRFGFICQEKEAPYCVALYELSDDFLAKGRAVWKRLLRQYREAQESKVYPGYPLGIEVIDPLPWMK